MPEGEILDLAVSYFAAYLIEGHIEESEQWAETAEVLWAWNSAGRN